MCAIALPPEGSGTLQYLDCRRGRSSSRTGTGGARRSSDLERRTPTRRNAASSTARGSFQGADCRSRCGITGMATRSVSTGDEALPGDFGIEAVAFGDLPGEIRARCDALVLLVDGGSFADDVAVYFETAGGRAMRSRARRANGGEARLRVFEVPGAGSGRLSVDDVPPGLSWPLAREWQDGAMDGSPRTTELVRPEAPLQALPQSSRVPNAFLRLVARFVPSLRSGRLPAPARLEEVTGYADGAMFVMLDPARCENAKELFWGRRPTPEAARSTCPRRRGEARARGGRVPRRRRLHRPLHARDDRGHARPSCARVRDRARGGGRTGGQLAPQRRHRTGRRAPRGPRRARFDDASALGRGRLGAPFLLLQPDALREGRGRRASDPSIPSARSCPPRRAS